jgi:hypothetical protein
MPPMLMAIASVARPCRPVCQSTKSVNTTQGGSKGRFVSSDAKCTATAPSRARTGAAPRPMAAMPRSSIPVSRRSRSAACSFTGRSSTTAKCGDVPSPSATARTAR